MVAEPAWEQVTLLAFSGQALMVQPPGPGLLSSRLPHSPLELEADTVAVLQDSHEGFGVILGRSPEGQSLGQPLHGQQPWLPEQPLIGQWHHAGPSQGLTCDGGGLKRGPRMRGQPGWGGGQARPMFSDSLWYWVPKKLDSIGSLDSTLHRITLIS